MPWSYWESARRALVHVIYLRITHTQKPLDKMPMPLEVIVRVNDIGTEQKIPTKLTYANKYGHEIEDTISELEYDSSSDTTQDIHHLKATMIATIVTALA